jgi:hypothetical protein
VKLLDGGTVNEIENCATADHPLVARLEKEIKEDCIK